MTPQELQDLLDELEASRASRKRAWENLQEIRWIMRDTVGIELPPPARKTIDLKGKLVKDGVKKGLRSSGHGQRATATIVLCRSAAGWDGCCAEGGEAVVNVGSIKRADLSA